MIPKAMGVGIAAVLAVPFLLSSEARPATTYKVRIGHTFKSLPAESMRFFPSHIDIHSGDVLQFEAKSLHTATLLPADTVVGEWRDAHASGFDKPFSYVVRDPDEAEDYKLNNAVMLASEPGCGSVAAPCSFDATGEGIEGVLNSGVSVVGTLDFSVRVTAPADTIFPVVSVPHPGMRMRVRVVPDEVPATDAEDIRVGMEDLLQEDKETADAFHSELLLARVSHRDKSGNRVWRAWAGYDVDHVALYGFYPQRLQVTPGDRVRWRFDALDYEDHSVTGPLDKALTVAGDAFSPACDPDGDEGSVPDYSPPDSEEPPFCNPPSVVEFDLPARFVLERGDGVVRRPGGFESSGVRGANIDGRSPYELRFPKRLNGTFRYLCVVHPYMRAGVVVRAREG